MTSGKLSAFLRSMKWRFYFTAIQIFFGYTLVVWPRLGFPELFEMLWLFVIFGPLLHGGIYTLNDILDLEEDKRHPVKRKRPLASGQLALREAYMFAITLILLSFILCYFISPHVLIFCFLFLVNNLLYSIILKKIPYVEIVANSLTHPLRFYTGVVAAGASAFHKIALLLWLFALSIAILKRKKEIMEKQQKSREVLRYYTNSFLRNFIVIVGIAILSTAILFRNLDFYFGVIVFILYLVIMIGYHRIRHNQQMVLANAAGS